MTSDGFLAAGLMAGFSIAMPIGPMGLLCIQRTLASGMGVGVSTGLGAATVNVVYGAVILVGAGGMTSWVSGGTRTFSAVGGLFLLYSAARTWLSQRTLGQGTPLVSSPLAAYVSAVLFNATNPAALILMLALLAPMVAHASPSIGDITSLLFGMFTAAAIWWLLLSGSVALLRSRLNAKMLGYVNQAAGLVLGLHGLLALAHAFRK